MAIKYSLFNITDENGVWSNMSYFQLLKSNKLWLEKKISEWGHQWKMLFDSDRRKQSSEVYFSRNLNQDSSLLFEFNDNTVQKYIITLTFHHVKKITYW